MTVKAPKGPGFVANIGRTGFYRVKYDDGILLDLKMLVDQKQITHVDRWAIQNDLFALCVAGKEDIENYLDFSDAYLFTVNRKFDQLFMFFSYFTLNSLLQMTGIK